MRTVVIILVLALQAPAAYAEVWGSVKSKIYHYRLCRWNAQIKPEYKVSFASPAAARKAGYHPCGKCRPPAAENLVGPHSAEKLPPAHNSY
jgi:methylphosphotriester-DNA--protein-cysteine methyltransferase